MDDVISFTNQYVSGTANASSCDEDLYLKKEYIQ